MSSSQFRAGTRLGWTLVGVMFAILGSFGVLIGVASHRARIRSEALAQSLISEFHNRLNSSQKDENVTGPYVDPSRIRALRSNLGRFESLKSCEVKEFIEPPSLRAKCLSHFEHGDAIESFVFKNYEGENSLLSYSEVASPATKSPFGKDNP